VNPESGNSENGFRFEPAAPSRQVTEAASWRFAAELVRRYPSRFTLIETHPGGGQYDCLTLLDQDEASDLERVDLNRAGSTFVWWRTDKSRNWAWRGCWPEIVATGDPRDLLDRLCERAGLTPITHVPSPTPAVVAYRVIAAFLAHATFGRVSWQCRNGYLDSSGMSGGRRDELFERFPQACQRLAVREPGDVLDIPAYRFWFLLKEDKPLLAIEAKLGMAWDVSGRETDLFAEYRTHHRIWPAVWAAAQLLLL
jgi:hypothetical protein